MSRLLRLVNESEVAAPMATRSRAQADLRRHASSPITGGSRGLGSRGPGASSPPASSPPASSPPASSPPASSLAASSPPASSLAARGLSAGLLALLFVPTLGCGFVQIDNVGSDAAADGASDALLDAADGSSDALADAMLADALVDSLVDAAADAPAPVCGNGTCEAGESRESCAADCTACIPPPGLSALESLLFALEADTWYEAPGTAMRSVCVPDSAGVRGSGGCTAVIKAWSGGTYDTTRNQMLIWGGGLTDYHGNEVYSFSVADGSWSRLTEPTTVDFLNQDPLPDGNPVGRHTYEGVEYVVDQNVMFGIGGARAGDGNGTAVTWTLNLNDNTWTNRSPAMPGPESRELASAYYPGSGRVFVRDAEALLSYDFAANQWSMLKDLSFAPEWPRYAVSGSKTMAADTLRGVLWSVGGGDILVWDIAAGALVTDAWRTTGAGSYSNATRVAGFPGQLFESGGGEVFNASAPGLDYDVAADALVAWANAGGPYALDLTTRRWTRGSGEGAPTSENSGGTFGRFRYIPDYNVFILINSVDENVFFYKHTRCAGE